MLVLRILLVFAGLDDVLTTLSMLRPLMLQSLIESYGLTSVTFLEERRHSCMTPNSTKSARVPIKAVNLWEKTHHTDSDVHENIIACTSDPNVIAELISNNTFHHERRIFFVSDVAFEPLAHNLTIQVNDDYLFLNTIDGSLREHYCINGDCFSNEIGRFHDQKLSFIDPRKLVDRRDDLNGVRFRILTGFQRPFVMFKNDTFDPSKNLVTESGVVLHKIERDNVYGLYNDLLETLTTKLNFTYDLYVREDRVWGGREGEEFTGVVKQLKDDEADFFFSSMTMTPDRFLAVDFLPTIGVETYGVFIRRQASQRIDWFVYLQPFSRDLRVVILIYTVVVTIVMRLAVGLSRPFIGVLTEVLETLGDLWGYSMLYLGRRPNGRHFQCRTGLRALFFFVCFVGNVIFLTYRASLTSELATRTQKLPFDSLEGLINSDYE